MNESYRKKGLVERWFEIDFYCAIGGYPKLSENCMQISTKHIHLCHCHSSPDTSLTTVSELQKKKNKVVYASDA